MSETFDAGNEKHVERRNQRIEEKLEREQEDLKKVLDLYGGRAFIWRLLEDCRIFKNSYTGEAEGTFFNEGKRAVGLKVLTEVLQLYPKAFTLMQSEAAARDAKEKQSL